MPVFHTQNVLNGGEISPLLRGRVDQPRYSTGAREMSNFVPMPQGGVTRRPGTRYLGTALGDGGRLLLEKAKAGALSQSVELAESVQAPVAQGDRLGTLTVSSGEEILAELPLLAGEEVPRISFRQMLGRMLKIACLAG